MTESPQPGHRDAKADAKAAKAYAKAQRPWFKKKRFIIPLAFVALMVIVAGTNGGGGGTGSTSGGSSTSAGNDADSDAGGKSEAQEPSVTADASAMIKEFEENEMAADAKYKGKWIQVNGSVNKVETEPFDGDKYYLQIGGGTDFELLTVNCHGMPQDELSTVSKGDTVSVVGEFDDGGSLGVELKNCRLA